MSNESVSSKSASGIEGVESRFCIACLFGVVVFRLSYL